MAMIKILDVTLSDNCRETHGDAVAIKQAAEQIIEQAVAMLCTWPQGSGMVMRFELHYERPPTPADRDDGK